jgi:hypothetical protein
MREESAPAPVERSAPGIDTLLEGSGTERSLSVLDLGGASEASFKFYAQFSRRIQFADILDDPSPGEGFSSRMETLGLDHHPRFDLVLAWDILDRLAEDDRPALVERLAEITAPTARLYVLVDASGRHETYPLHFSVLGPDQVLQQTVGPARSAGQELLPAEVERLLRPFRVVHAFTLRHGWREYVAVKGG